MTGHSPRSPRYPGHRAAPREAGRAARGDLLSAREECDLAAAVALGDDAARDRLIRSNLRLVFELARSYLGRGIEWDDLVGEGTLGLIRAAEAFSPDFGARFGTYAAYWIKQAIYQALVGRAAAIRLPVHMVVMLSKWRRAEEELARESGRAPAFDQVASAMGLSVVQREMVGHALRTRRLKGVGDEAGLAEAGPSRLESAVERSDSAEYLRSLMAARLDQRERQVIALRFGLEGRGPLTLQEVGGQLGITREWARQLERRALAKLRPRDGPPPNPGRAPR